MFGTQTNETIAQNVRNWNELHSNASSDEGLKQYNAERIKKHKIRIIESFRKNSRT